MGEYVMNDHKCNFQLIVNKCFYGVPEVTKVITKVEQKCYFSLNDPLQTKIHLLSYLLSNAVTFLLAFLSTL